MVIAFRRLLCCLVAAGVVLTIACIPLGRALAHAGYERSEPPDGGVVAEAPTHVHIYFTQELFRRQGMNGIEVYDTDGRRVDRGDPVIDDDNRRLMSVTLEPALADGLYTVRWFSLSAEDGHEGAGEFTFTISTAGTTTSAALITDTDRVTATDVVTVIGVTTGEVAATVTAQVAGELTPEPEVTATQATPTPVATPSGIPCLGGAAPLGLMLGLAWIGRRRAQNTHG